MSLKYQSLLGLSTLISDDIDVESLSVKHLRIPTGAQKDYILTSDVIGNGSWKPIPELEGDIVGNIKMTYQRNKYVGNWRIEGDFRAGNMVSHEDSLWFAIINNIGVVPGSDETVWRFVCRGITEEEKQQIQDNAEAIVDLQSDVINIISDVSSNTERIEILENEVINATPNNVANTLVKRDGNGSFASNNISANMIRNINPGQAMQLRTVADTFGDISLSLMNRFGTNGMIVQNHDIDLFTFAQVTSTGKRMNIIVEGRALDMVAPANAINQGAEMTIQVANASGSEYTRILYGGKAEMGILSNLFKMCQNTTVTSSGLTTNALTVSPGLMTGTATNVLNDVVIGKILNGYVKGAGTVSSSDSILSAIQKVDGNTQLLDDRKYIGHWDNTVNYKVGNQVSKDNAMYVAVNDNVNSDPTGTPVVYNRTFTNPSITPSGTASATSYTMGITFKTTVDAQLTGIKFYLASDAYCSAVKLWSLVGETLLYQESVSVNTPGWNTVTLTTPYSITANTVYVAGFVVHNKYMYGIPTSSLDQSNELKLGDTANPFRYGTGTTAFPPYLSVDNFCADVVVSIDGGTIPNPDWMIMIDGVLSPEDREAINNLSDLTDTVEQHTIDIEDLQTQISEIDVPPHDVEATPNTLVMRDVNAKIKATNIECINLNTNNINVFLSSQTRRSLYIGHYAANTVVSSSGGFDNIAIGYSSMYSNTSATDNIAIGSYSLYSTTNGWNTAIGSQAGRYVTNGGANVFIGSEAGAVSGSRAISALNCTLIGNQTGVANSSAIAATAIGFGAIATANNQVMLGGHHEVVVTTPGKFVAPVLELSGSTSGHFRKGVLNNYWIGCFFASTVYSKIYYTRSGFTVTLNFQHLLDVAAQAGFMTYNEALPSWAWPSSSIRDPDGVYWASCSMNQAGVKINGFIKIQNGVVTVAGEDGSSFSYGQTVGILAGNSVTYLVD